MWAKDVKTKVGPFLKKSFPSLKSYQIRLDGEKLLHAPAAKTAFRLMNITILPGWPKYSPDLNPQENVWAWTEPELRKREKATDTFRDFGTKVVSAVNALSRSRNVSSWHLEINGSRLELSDRTSSTSWQEPWKSQPKPRARLPGFVKEARKFGDGSAFFTLPPASP